MALAAPQYAQSGPGSHGGGAYGMTDEVGLREFVREYQDALNDLKAPVKSSINALTMLAAENKGIASSIAAVVENHLVTCLPEHQLPALYLLDSIAKNARDPYVLLFARNLPQVFSTVWERAAPRTRSSLERLLATWTGVFPEPAVSAITSRLALQRAGVAAAASHLASVPATSVSAAYAQPEPQQFYGAPAPAPAYPAAPAPNYSYAQPQAPGGGYGQPQYGGYAQPAVSQLMAAPAFDAHTPVMPMPEQPTGHQLPPPPSLQHSQQALQHFPPLQAPHMQQPFQQPAAEPATDMSQLLSLLQSVQSAVAAAPAAPTPPPMSPVAQPTRHAPGMFDPARLKEFDSAAVESLLASSESSRSRQLDRLFLHRQRLKHTSMSSRRWYVDLDTWLAGTADTQAVPAEGEEGNAAAAVPQHSVPVHDSQTHCGLSGERFETYWDTEHQEWRYKGAKALDADEAAGYGVPEGTLVLVTCLGSVESADVLQPLPAAAAAAAAEAAAADTELDKLAGALADAIGAAAEGKGEVAGVQSEAGGSVGGKRQVETAAGDGEEGGGGKRARLEEDGAAAGV